MAASQGPDPCVCFRNQPGKKKSTESQVVTFRRLRCRYLRRAFFTAKPKHRFETGVAREAARFEIGATSVFPSQITVFFRGIVFS